MVVIFDIVNRVGFLLKITSWKRNLLTTSGLLVYVETWPSEIAILCHWTNYGEQAEKIGKSLSCTVGVLKFLELRSGIIRLRLWSQNASITFANI